MISSRFGDTNDLMAPPAFFVNYYGLRHSSWRFDNLITRTITKIHTEL